MTNYKLFAVLSALYVCLCATPAATQSHSQREMDYVVALVNSEPITRNEVRHKQSHLLQGLTAQGMSTAASAPNFEQVLERLINERVLLQIATDYGVRISDAQLLQTITSIAQQQQLNNLTELKTKYEAQGGNWTLYQEEIRDELLRAQLREREVNGRVRISEDEIDLAVQNQNLNTVSSQAISLAHLLIPLPDNPSSPEVTLAKSRAQRILEQAKRGVDFAKLTEQTSLASEGVTTGVMALRATNRYPTIFVDATSGLQVGEVSELLQSDAGFHILKLLERQNSTTKMVVQSRVRHILLPITAQMSEAQAMLQLQNYKTQIETNTRSFSALAQEHSVDGSAVQGGDLGWTMPGLFVPEFERVMNALPTGKLSAPFTSRYGVHLLEVTDRQTVAVPEREQREEVRQQLRDKKAAQSYLLWLADVRARAFVEYRNVTP